MLLRTRILTLSLSVGALFLGNTAYGRSIWVQATGLDPVHTDLNYVSFYEEQIAFEAACKLDSNRECHSLIDLGLGLMGFNSNQIKDIQSKFSNHKFERLPATRSLVLRTIQDILNGASSGDQIVIGLNDHGRPSTSKHSPSCMSFSRELVCENEIAEIIKNSRISERGIRVLIVANACFSGGFNNLSARNICVVSTAAQRQASQTSMVEFWPTLLKNLEAGKVRAVSDIKKIFDPVQSSVRLASSAENERMCDATREMVLKQISSPPQIGFGEWIRIAASGVKKNPSKSDQGFSDSLSYSTLLLLQIEHLKPISGRIDCSERPNHVCDQLNDLLQVTPSFRELLYSDSVTDNAIYGSSFIKQVRNLLPCLSHWDLADSDYGADTQNFPVRTFSAKDLADANYCEDHFSLE